MNTEKVDKRKNNGGARAGAGRTKKEIDPADAPSNTTVQVEPSVIAACRTLHGSLAKALRFAALHPPTN